MRNHCTMYVDTQDFIEFFPQLVYNILRTPDTKNSLRERWRQMRKEAFSYCDMYVLFAVPFSLEEGTAFCVRLENLKKL